MKKHFIRGGISFLLLILLGVILFFTIPRFKYKYNATYDGYEITGYYGLNKEITIPNSYKNKKIVGIRSRAFKDKKIKSIHFNEDLIYIKKEAFRNTLLKEVEIPSSVIEIEQNAFSYNSKLETFKLKENSSLDYIAGSLFFNDLNLKTVEIGSVKSIGSLSFFNCKSLENLNLENASIIYEKAFYGTNLNLTLSYLVTLKDGFDDGANIKIKYV